MAPNSLRLTAAARRDIEGIRQHTLETWGRETWLEYVTGADEIFRRILDNPLVGVNRDGLAPRLRSVLYRSHIIFFTTTQSGQRVVLRMLHQKQNAEALAWARTVEGDEG